VTHRIRLALLASLGGVLFLAGCPSNDTPDSGGEADAAGLDAPGLDAPGRDAPVTPDAPADAPVGPRCGDGAVDEGEACDDGNEEAGDGCDAACTTEDGWECDGASPTVCLEVCGDGQLVGDEAGAGGCDDGNTAAGDGCDELCKVEEGYACTDAPSVCMPGCGDGIVIAPAEACDDANSDGGDGCSSACTIEEGWECEGAPSTCIEVGICGDGLLRGMEACDDADTEDGDGCSATCTVEVGFDCAGEPSACAATCGDGVVASTEQCDDGNTTSFDGCHRDCRSETEIEPNEDGTPSIGGTGPQGNDFDATAVANADANGAIDEAWLMSAMFGVPGDEDVFAYVNDSTIDQSVTFAIFSDTAGTCAVGFDPSLTIRDAAGAQLARDDNSGPERCPVLTYVVPVGATVYVHVTEYGDNGTGAYVLSIGLCTDGVVGGSEICDDGNTTSGDGCDNNCTVSACGNGVVAGVEVCDDGNTASGDGCDSTCVPSGCGNGVVAGLEVCDDGNAVNGDGCDENCTVTACGNGVTSAPETCDDGNTTSGDGCDANCTPTGCPNGIRTGTEVCDDGNAVNGDGCDNDCDVGTTCGDGTLQSFEQCDDGARVPGDGCDRLCQRETGYACTGVPSVCAPVCGDGRTIPPEVCDDGNTVGGDSCEADCRTTLCSGSDTEPNGTRAQASCLPLAATRPGRIDPTGDQDFWAFTLTGNFDVRVETWDASGSTCAALDTVIDLYRGDGTRLITDDNDGVGNCSLVDPAVAADAAAVNLPAGTYYLRVRLLSVDEVGDYSVRVTTTPGPVCGDMVVGRGEECDDGNTAGGDGCTEACRIETTPESEPNEDGTPSTGGAGIGGNDYSSATANGPYSGTTRISGALNPAGDEDVFAVTNTGATARSVRFSTFTAVGGTCPSADTGLNVRDAAGTVLVSDDDGGDGFCSLTTYSIPPGGTVYVHVTDYGDNGALLSYFLDIVFL
jgi:cysteine-rich repeat protein